MISWLYFWYCMWTQVCMCTSIHIAYIKIWILYHNCLYVSLHRCEFLKVHNRPHASSFHFYQPAKDSPSRRNEARSTVWTWCTWRAPFKQPTHSCGVFQPLISWGWLVNRVKVPDGSLNSLFAPKESCFQSWKLLERRIEFVSDGICVFF